MPLGQVARALVLDINFTWHGLPATVSVPGEAPVETRVLWSTPQTEAMPSGAEFSRGEPIRVAVLRRNHVPKVPVGTVIVAAEKQGDDLVTWIVDGHERQEADHNRVYVIRQACD